MSPGEIGGPGDAPIAGAAATIPAYLALLTTPPAASITSTISAVIVSR